MMLKKDFGALIRAERKALGLSQLELAEIVDLDIRHIHNIESGKCDLHFSTVLRLAAYLKIDLNEFKECAVCDENGNYRKDLFQL